MRDTLALGTSPSDCCFMLAYERQAEKAARVVRPDDTDAPEGLNHLYGEPSDGSQIDD